MTIEVVKGKLRIKLKNPTLFKKSSFEIIGNPGGPHVRGKLKKTGKWTTQMQLFELQALRDGKQNTWRRLHNTMDKLPFTKKKKVKSLLKLHVF